MVEAERFALPMPGCRPGALAAWLCLEKESGANDGCRPRCLLLDRQAPLLFGFVRVLKEIGQVAGNCTRFSGVTSRCSAD